MKVLRPLLVLVGSALSAAAAAEDRLFLAGGEVADTAYYAYSGMIVPGPGRDNGRGFLQRYWVDRLGYEYDGGPGRIKASAYGLEAALGYGTSSALGWSTVSLGVRYTDTTLTPDDPLAGARGGQLSAKLQLEVERAVGDAWRAGAIASFTTGQDAYWARARVMRRTSRASSLGLEAVAGGNADTDSVAGGLVLVLRPPAAAWSIGLKGGYRRQDGENGAYGGVEIGFAF